MSRLVVRPARVEDVKHYYPDVGASFKAWVAELDGVVEGIVGLVLTRPVACLVSGFSEALRPYLKSLPILKAIKRAYEACKAHNGMIIAVQERTEEQSPVILARLGFEPFKEIDGDIWHVFGG